MRVFRSGLWVLAGCAAVVWVASAHAAEPPLTAARIVARNIASRGGLDAWRKVHSMVWVGRIESIHVPASGLPFVLELKGKDKTRFEVKSRDQVSIRVFDGKQGWKLRSVNNARPRLQPYTRAELKFARDSRSVGVPPLLDYRAKGTTVTLGGVEQVDGHKAYRLDVTLASGVRHHVWIDTRTFLDIKSDRQARNAFGQTGTVSVYYRNFRTIENLKIPLTIESGADRGKTMDKMSIDRVVLNAFLPDWVFTRASLVRRYMRGSAVAHMPRQGVAVTRVPPMSGLRGNR